MDLTGADVGWSAASHARWLACLARTAHDNRYWRTPPYRGVPELRTALASRIGVAAGSITVTSGVRAAALVAVGEASLVRIEAPTFLGVVELFRRAGRRVELASWPRLWRDAPPGAAVWLTSPGRNPDGATLTTLDRDELAAAINRGVRVVVNQTNRWMCQTVAAPTGATTVGSFAKVLGMGARLGYAVLPNEPGPLDRTACPPTGWQLGWAEFFSTGGFENVCRESVEPARLAADRIRRRLVTAGLAKPGGEGLSYLLSAPNGMDEGDAVQRAAGSGLRVSPGHDFAAPQPAFRLTVSGVPTAQLSAVTRLLVGLVKTRSAPFITTNPRGGPDAST